MRLSSPLFRIVRRKAADVLQSVETKLQAEPGLSEPSAFFAELPDVLQRFFKKYPPPPFRTYAEKPRLVNDVDANPFLPNKHPVTERWHAPQYSMRRQADLYKAAYRFGVEDLMPPLMHNRKFYEARYAEEMKLKGAKFFKLSEGERKAPIREREVADAYKQLDATIAERKGAKHLSKVKRSKLDLVK